LHLLLFIILFGTPVFLVEFRRRLASSSFNKHVPEAVKSLLGLANGDLAIEFVNEFLLRKLHDFFAGLDWAELLQIHHSSAIVRDELSQVRVFPIGWIFGIELLLNHTTLDSIHNGCDEPQNFPGCLHVRYTG
jgi:hypothetical protein